MYIWILKRVQLPPAEDLKSPIQHSILPKCNGTLVKLMQMVYNCLILLSNLANYVLAYLSYDDLDLFFFNLDLIFIGVAVFQLRGQKYMPPLS